MNSVYFTEDEQRKLTALATAKRSSESRVLRELLTQEWDRAVQSGLVGALPRPDGADSIPIVNQPR